MSTQHSDFESHGYHEHVTETAAVGSPFGVAQAIALVVGIFFIVIGVVGLARAGLHSFVRPAVLVGPFRATPLLSLLHLLAGLGALAGATTRFASRAVMMALAPLLIAFGIIVLLQPMAGLGYRTANGVLYLVTGVVALVAAIATPAIETARHEYVATG